MPYRSTYDLVYCKTLNDKTTYTPLSNGIYVLFTYICCSHVSMIWYRYISNLSLARITIRVKYWYLMNNIYKFLPDFLLYQNIYPQTNVQDATCILYPRNMYNGKEIHKAHAGYMQNDDNIGIMQNRPIYSYILQSSS